MRDDSVRKNLVEEALRVRSNAYAPYSVYHVGAAVLGQDGSVYTGCNVENVSYGLCLCAERSAIAAMIAGGCPRFTAIAVATKDGGTPCGMCRQVMAELAAEPDVPVWCTDLNGEVLGYTVGSLLPAQFETDLKQ